MTSRLLFYALSLLLAAATSFADDDNDGHRGRKTRLSGANEIPVNLSTGTGVVSLSVTEAPASISITISYSGLTGNANVAHLHLGNPWENGLPVVTICGGTSGRQCPAQGTEQTFTFPLTGNAITAIPAQAFTADVATLIRALDKGMIYANVHTNAFPNGEIRGQLGRGRSMGNENPGRGHGRGKPDK